MPTFLTPFYNASVAMTITLASLATSSTRTGGRESTAISNTVTVYPDVMLSGKITTGTSPTANRQIDVWVYADDGNDSYPDVLDGTDSDETITSENVRNSALKLAASIRVDATSDRTYFFRCESIANLFGGVMPRKWGVFVTHDTGVNLNATGSNHEIRYMPVYFAMEAS